MRGFLIGMATIVYSMAILNALIAPNKFLAFWGAIVFTILYGLIGFTNYMTTE